MLCRQLTARVGRLRNRGGLSPGARAQVPRRCRRCLGGHALDLRPCCRAGLDAGRLAVGGDSAGDISSAVVALMARRRRRAPHRAPGACISTRSPTSCGESQILRRLRRRLHAHAGQHAVVHGALPSVEAKTPRTGARRPPAPAPAAAPAPAITAGFGSAARRGRRLCHPLAPRPGSPSTHVSFAGNDPRLRGEWGRGCWTPCPARSRSSAGSLKQAPCERRPSASDRRPAGCPSLPPLPTDAIRRAPSSTRRTTPSPARRSSDGINGHSPGTGGRESASFGWSWRRRRWDTAHHPDRPRGPPRRGEGCLAASGDERRRPLLRPVRVTGTGGGRMPLTVSPIKGRRGPDRGRLQGRPRHRRAAAHGGGARAAAGQRATGARPGGGTELDEGMSSSPPCLTSSARRFNAVFGWAHAPDRRARRGDPARAVATIVRSASPRPG